MAEFVTCSQDSVVFWDNKSFSSKKSSQPFSGSGYHVASAFWSSSNSKLMVAPKWGDSIVWCEPATDVSSWNTIWHRDSGHFTCGCLMSNSRYLLSGSSDGLLMLWDVKTRSSTKTFEGFTSPVTGVVSSCNDQLVLSGAQDGSLLLHTLSSSHALQHTITLSHTDMEPQAAITRLRFSVMDRALAASTNETGSVCLWSVESQRLLHQFTSSHTGSATDLCFAHSNNKLLVSVGQDSKIHFLDIQQRKEVMLVTTPSPLTSVAILRDGYTIAAGGVDGKLYVYELRAMKSPKHSISAHQGAVTCITEQNTAKSSRGSSRGSTHSSKKSAKDSSRQSVLTSADDSPDVGGTPGTSQCTQHDSTISSLPPTDTPQPSQPPHLTPHPSASSSSSQLPSLPVVTQAPTSGPSAVHQTPFAAPRAPSGMQWAQFFTPAQSSGDKDSTGIFSPVESTPHPVLVGGSSDGNSTRGGSKATAAIPPTQRPQETDGRPPQDVRGYPVMSTFIASTPATQPPLGMSGIFSPLDAPTPATLTLARPAVGGWSTVLRHAPSATPSATTPALSGVSTVRPPPNLIAGHSENTSALPPPPTSSSLHTQHTLTSTTDITSTPPQSSLSPQSSSFTGSSASQPMTSTTPPAAEPRGSAVEGIGTVPTAFGQPPQSSTSQPGASIHMQYLEKIIRDSNEELRYATHRDIRALGLDMFRQFLILQQQFGSAVSVLNEKIERLSEENRHLQEQLHQYTPKY